MKKILIVGALLAACSAASAQSPIIQSGSVTPGHAWKVITNGVAGDAGTAANGSLTSLGVTASGPALCQNSGPVTGPYNQLCFSLTGTGGGFSWFNYGGATGTPTFNINGTLYPFFSSGTGNVLGPSTSTIGCAAPWANTTGTQLANNCGLSLNSFGTATFDGAVLMPSLGTVTPATAGQICINSSGVLGANSSPCVAVPISTGVSGLGTNVATALEATVGSAGAFVVNGGALGTPSGGTITNLTGTASININGTVGATTPAAGSFLPLNATGHINVKARTATSTSDSISATTDYLVCADNSGGAAGESLPSSPATGDTYLIKDCSGAAATHNITISPASGNIDGASSYVMSTSYQSVAVTYTGSQWSIN